MFCIVNIVIPATSPATNLTKTVAKNSYSLLEYLNGMHGVSGSSPLGSIIILALKTICFNNIALLLINDKDLLIIENLRIGDL